MNSQPAPSRLEVLRVALKLGCISFGEPVAHPGYFHAGYVQRRRWLTEAIYAESGVDDGEAALSGPPPGLVGHRDLAPVPRTRRSAGLLVFSFAWLPCRLCFLLVAHPLVLRTGARSPMA